MCITDEECLCPKRTCKNHGKCSECVKKHRDTDSLPYCLFPENGGDKSILNYFKYLSVRFKEQ